MSESLKYAVKMSLGAAKLSSGSPFTPAATHESAKGFQSHARIGSRYAHATLAPMT